jgi:hypothetical protein
MIIRTTLKTEKPPLELTNGGFKKLVVKLTSNEKSPFLNSQIQSSRTI